MRHQQEHARAFWSTLIAFTIIVNITALRKSLLRWDELGVALHRSVWGGMLLVYIVVLIACIWACIKIFRPGKLHLKTPSIFDLSKFDGIPGRVLGIAVFLTTLFAIPYIKLTFQIGQDVKKTGLDHVLVSILFYWMCWWVLLLAMASLKIAFRTTWQGGFASALIIMGVSYEILMRFNAVTNYPLSMGWSEGSRYYYASLYFSKWLYGESMPLSTLHPTRYLLQSIPFLFPSLGLTAHRFWQFFLWIGLTAGAAIALARRVFFHEKAVQWLFAGWFFLFLLRVGVYYHLEVMVIIPLLFVSIKHPRQSLVAVIFSSVWAGVSRVNWFPVPAMIAIAIYLLETPVRSQTSDPTMASLKHRKHYLSLPTLWAVTGLVSALATQAIYIPLSGNAGNAQAFASSFTSDLLWYRLWPNDNNFLGVFPAILIVSGPMIVTVIISMYRHWHALHPVRWLGLFSMLILLFAGCLIVSVKIGGGGDLHNMDTYAILIGIVFAYFISGQAQVEPGEAQLMEHSWSVMVIALLIPILFLIPLFSPYTKYDESRNLEAYQQVTQFVNEIGKKGSVLFINERQLVTFGDVDLPLVPEYEIVTLMEMAMSNNRTYLNAFYDDLAKHRFAAIVAGKQNLTIKQTGPLMEENNVWNSRVSPYILCYYEPSLSVRADMSNIQVFIPRNDSGICP